MVVSWRQAASPRALLVVLTVVVVLALLVGGTASAAVFGAYNPSWDGASELRATASATETETVIAGNTSEYPTAAPEEAVGFILSPESRYTPADAARVEAFVRSGGTLVVAEDFGTASNPLLASIGADARVDGRLLRDERFYGESPEMPTIQGLNEHTYTEGVEALTLNRPTAVEPNGSTVLATSSNYTYADANLNGELDDSESLRQFPVATVESVGSGEVVVLGDPSLFINVMIDRSDNRAFVENLLETHETAIIDVSQVDAVPPLVAARLTLQGSVPLQLVVGVLFVVGISYWGVSRELLSTICQWLGPTTPPERPTQPKAIEQRIRARFPEWDEDRVQRVREEVIKRQQTRKDND